MERVHTWLFLWSFPCSWSAPWLGWPVTHYPDRSRCSPHAGLTSGQKMTLSWALEPSAARLAASVPPAFPWPWPRADVLARPSARLPARGMLSLRHSCRSSRYSVWGAAPPVFLAAVERGPMDTAGGVWGPGARGPLLPGRQPELTGPGGGSTCRVRRLTRYTLQGAWESGPHLCGPTPWEGCTQRRAFRTLSWPRAPVHSLSWTECLRL